MTELSGGAVQNLIQDAQAQIPATEAAVTENVQAVRTDAEIAATEAELEEAKLGGLTVTELRKVKADLKRMWP